MRKLILIYLKICLTIVASQLLCVAEYAHSEEIDYEFGGIIYEQPTYFFINDDNYLNPDNDIFEFSEWLNRFYGRVNFKVNSEKTKIVTQFRPTIQSDEEDTEFDFFTDDAYFDVNPAKEYFVYIGKRNLPTGVAFGANPTDFLGETKVEDFTKREEERRIERAGNYLIGVDAFFKNTTLSAIYAPEIDDWQDEENRALLKVNYFAESINTDTSLHLFDGEIPGIGFDLSSTISDSLILYTESALRWGSNKKEINILNYGDDNTPRDYEITDPDDSDDIYPHIVVGGSYTFGNGTNLILEYIYNDRGYNSEEWDDIIDFLKYNHDAYKNKFFSDLAKGNLARANEDIIKFREMRKNYLFLRISDSKMIENTDVQIVFQLNADDMSYLIFPSIDYKVGTNTIIGLSSTMFFGEDDSEFGLMFWEADVSLIIKYYF